MNRRSFIVNCVVLFCMMACSAKKADEKLPIYGRKQIVVKEVDGKAVSDTVYHTIRDFSFVNQDSLEVTNATFDGQVYVADFFFTSCPTICPKMKKQMLRVYNKFESDPQVSILSHTIDPKYDSVSVLKDFSDRLGVKSPKWNFVTGDMDDIYDIGERSYMITAGADENAPGGYIHSGAFLLVDKDRRVRGIYDGTLADEVDVLINDIPRLLKEYEN